MKKPILVTGSHKSGTTWTGKAIAFSKKVGYLSEPFNLNQSPGKGRLPFDCWFQYIDSRNNHEELKNHLHKIFNFKYPLSSELQKVNTIKDVLRLLKGWAIFTTNWLGEEKRPLMKDPIAIMSAEWLQKAFNMDVIVLIRHPASFVSSIKKYRWSHPFEHFLQQEKLIKNKLQRFENEIEEFGPCSFSHNSKSLIEQGILLWKIIYWVVKQYREVHDEWLFVKQEDLATDPIGQFHNIYRELGLDYTQTVQNQIAEITKTNNPKEVQDNEGGKIKRDSKAQVKIFKERLSEEEIEQVKEETRDVWEFFYTEDDW